MSFKFTGKRAVVTGAASGIGHDVAIALAEREATVLAVDVMPKQLEALKAENNAIQIFEADLRNVDSIRAAMEKIGDVDLLVNCAGVTALESFLDVTPEKFDFVMSVNIRGMLFVGQAAARNMVKRGCGGAIVNISSQASKVALKDHSAYCSSKGAVDQLTRVMALELGPHNIRTNAINPTVVMTAMGKQAWSDPEKAKPALDRIPLHRFAEVNEVVDPILYLLSNESSMINGAILSVDGGYTAC